MNRQRVLLFCLLILFVLSMIWSYSRMPRQKSVSTLKYPPGQQVAPAVGSAPLDRRQGGALRLDLLDREVPDFKGYRRNIFKPVFVDEVKMAQLKAVAVKRRPLPPPPPPVPIQPVVTEMPRPELAKFTFLGFLQKGKRRIIFLSRDKEIILVKQGDIFAGRYEASSITDQALTIRVTDTSEEIVIPLVEYSSLRPAG
jgi:hypothetical protein